MFYKKITLRYCRFIVFINTDFDFCNAKSFNYIYYYVVILTSTDKRFEHAACCYQYRLQHTFNHISNNNDPRGTQRCALLCRNVLM